MGGRAGRKLAIAARFFMYYDKKPEVRASALKHGIGADDSLQAAEHPLLTMDLDHTDSSRELRLGFDTHGRLLEVVVAKNSEGRQFVIHAMKARKLYRALLPKGWHR